jgi:hypothetical protein
MSAVNLLKEGVVTKMIKNFVIAAVIAAGFTGMIVISAGSAEADRNRDSRFNYIGRAGGCDVYGYQGVFVTYGKDCDVAAR